MLRSRPLGGEGLALGHGLAALEAQVHSNVVAGAALAGLGAAQDGIDQAGRYAELARQLGLREALFVHPLAGLRLGAKGCSHGVWVLICGGLVVDFDQRKEAAWMKRRSA